MPLPGDITLITVTGTYPTVAGQPMSGYVTFTPSVDLTDPVGRVILRAAPITVNLDGGMFAVSLPCTDNANIAPANWVFDFAEYVGNPPASVPARAFPILLPHTLGPSVDVSAISPTVPQPPASTVITTTSPIAASGSPSAGQVLTATSSSTATWQPSSGGVQIGQDIGGTDQAPEVISTHLSEPLPAGQGGTGEATLQAMLDAAAGATTAGHVLRGDGTHITLSAIEAGDLPEATAETAGVAQFGSAPADFQPDGVPTAGSTGLMADVGHAHPLQPWQFLITEYGARGDLVCVIDAVTNATAVVTSPSGAFTADMVGKAAVGKSFLTGGVTSLVTTVASYQSANQITLNAAATSTATGLQLLIGTDDTAHIQATIDAAMAYSSPLGVAAQVVTPLAPGGFGYMIAGPLKNVDTLGNAVYNSQLTTGLHSDRLPGKVIEFVGPVDAGSTRHWNQNYPTLTGGTWFSAGVFASQAAQASTDPHSIANGGNPSVLGGPTGRFGYGTTGTNPNFNNLTVRLVNMSIMNTHSASGWSYCPFNFYGTARAQLIRCGFGTSGVVQYYTGAGGSGGNTDFANPSLFSGGASLGGLMPAAGNNDDSLIEDSVWSGGYTYGPLLAEHTVCKGANRSMYNWIGLNVAGTYGDGGTGAGSLHAIDLGQWSVEACSYHLGVWGAGAAGIGPYIYGTLDTEGTVQVRGVSNIAANLQALSGDVHLAGSPSAPTFTFPTNLHLIKDTQPRGPVTSPAYTLGTPQINTYWRDATVTISGGTVAAVKVSALAGGATAPTMTTLAGVTSGTFRVPAGCWWEIDGSAAPTTMQWVLD